VPVGGPTTAAPTITVAASVPVIAPAAAAVPAIASPRLTPGIVALVSSGPVSQEPMRTAEENLESARQRLAEFEQQLNQLRRERTRLDLERAQAELKARQGAWAAELEALRRRHEETLKLVDMGGATQVAVSQLRAQIAAVERDMRTAEAEMKFRSAVTALESREVEQTREYAQRPQERAAAVRALEITKERQAQQTARLEESLKALDREFGQQAVAGARQTPLIEQSTVVLSGPDARVRTGDVVIAEIDGEDQLPRAYVVSSNGTIRLPLLGAIRVEGLTAVEIESAVARQLTDRRLGTGSRIHVTLRRPRTAGER
jgi:hypothetical protein